MGLDQHIFVLDEPIKDVPCCCDGCLCESCDCVHPFCHCELKRNDYDSWDEYYAAHTCDCNCIECSCNNCVCDHEQVYAGVEVCYWRKYYWLEAWFSTRFAPNGVVSEFNAVPVLLTEEIVDKLCKDLTEETPPVEGNQWSARSVGDYTAYKDYTRCSLLPLKWNIHKGKSVYYISSW